MENPGNGKSPGLERVKKGNLWAFRKAQPKGKTQVENHRKGWKNPGPKPFLKECLVGNPRKFPGNPCVAKKGLLEKSKFLKRDPRR